MAAGKNEVSLWERTQWICDMIFHQLTAAVTAIILWIFVDNFKANTIIFWHYILNTLAYVPLMAEGFLLFSDSHGWSRKLSKNAQNIVHGTLLSLSTAAVTVGNAFYIYHKNQGRMSSHHFKSNHAITGLVSWILCIASILIGLIAANSQKLKNLVRPVVLKFVHNFLGLAAFSIGLASLILGLHYRMFARFLTEKERKAIDAMVIIVGVYAGFRSLRSLGNQLKEIFS